MSFLDDSSATLQEALAFIDAHTTSEDSSSSPIQRKPRKIGYWQRIKAESDSLRQEATKLEKTLSQLQATGANPMGRDRHLLSRPSAGVGVSALLEHEFQRRLQAESTNQDLKSVIARNLKVIETLSTLSVQEPGNVSPILSALAIRSDRLELNVAAILSRVGLLDAKSFLHRTQREIDPQLGSVVEIVSSVPLAISKQETDEIIWRRFTVDAEVYAANPHYTKLAVGGFAKSHSSTFAFGGERFKLTSHMLLRRRLVMGDVVYFWTASTSVPNTGIEFMEEGLIAARDGEPSSIQRPALFQYWHRIHAEEYAAAHERLATTDLELLKESAMRLRNHLSMSYLQALENSLVSGNISAICYPSLG